MGIRAVKFFLRAFLVMLTGTTRFAGRRSGAKFD
jgi:hypothetical protein